MSTKLNVEIEDGLIPDGMEIVRVGFYKQGEKVVTVKGTAVDCLHDCNDGFVYLIVRPIWQPPAWLKPGWIWTDNGLLWRWSAIAPTWNKHNKWWSNATSVEISREAFDFVPPPCTEPSQSLREIKGPQQ